MRASDDKHVGLAPMEGTTEFPTRLWFAMTSQPERMGTPFVRVTDSYPRGMDDLRQHWPELDYARGALPYHLVPQLMASDPERFVRVAEEVLEHHPIVELNCGCPSKRVVGRGSGSSLLQDPQEFREFINYAGSHLPGGSLSVKIRTGFNNVDDYEELIDILAKQPLAQVVIHGRTRDQGYTGLADWEKISYGTQVLPCPVIGSGDVEDFRSYDDHKNKVSGIIIGRGALKNPWVFEEIRQAQPVEVNGAVLAKALACFGILNDLHRSDENRLKEFVLSGKVRCLGRNLDGWGDAFGELCALRFGRTFELSELELSRPIVARVKMMWNYMRQRFPEPTRDPMILREWHGGRLLSKVEEVLQRQGSRQLIRF